MSRRVASLLALGTLLALAGPASAAGPGGWSTVGGGLNDSVTALNSDEPGKLYVGGTFTNAGGNAAADYLAVWNGTSFAALGADGDFNVGVDAIAVQGGKVYAGGRFTNAAGNAGADYLAVWAGAGWAPFCGPFNARVQALEVIGSTLFVGGSFTDVGSDPAADGLVACDLVTGVPSAVTDDDPDIDGGIQALAADSAGDLYVGGTFIDLDADDVAANDAADYVAKLDVSSASWSPLGENASGNGAIDTANVDALATSGTDVYVATDDVDVADIPQADHVVRWNGSSWSALGSGGAGSDGWLPANAAVNALLPFESRLYATGAFNDAGGDPLADGIAVLDAGVWHGVGSDGSSQGPFGPNGAGDGNALAAYDGNLVAGGTFVDAGGDALADRLASFPLLPKPPAGQDPAPAPVVTPPPKRKKCKKGRKLKRGKCVKKKRKK